MSFEVGYDAPAAIGMPEREVQTPCLVLDLDALERNVAGLSAICARHGVRHRAHAKMHKSVDVAQLQMTLGGAVGVCCQKVSEAEVFARGGVDDILITNQVRDPLKLDRLARIPSLGARVIVCVDDIANVAELSAAAQRRGAAIECLVEIECGLRRCGVTTVSDVVAIAQAIDRSPGLKFSGLQAYNGAAQHLARHDDRAAAMADVIAIARAAIDALAGAGLRCAIVGGGGTGTIEFDAASGVINELQCGSYAFMDAAYGAIRNANDVRFDQAEWENALFVLAGVMSCAQPGRAVVDAGLKAYSVDSGLPRVFGEPDLAVIACSDEHSVIADPRDRLRVNDRLRLVPGHCDPTCNLHDWYVGLRDGRVEALWPVSARGRIY